jgi:threonine dehydratase
MTRTPDLAEPLSETEIEEARRRIAGAAVRTPLVPRPDGSAWLKLECLQPTGSYKIRGATNALKARLEAGEEIRAIVTASAGNFGQAIARAATSFGLPCIIHAPDYAARVKVETLKRMGAEVREHDFAAWWHIMQTRETGDDGTFFHPVCEREMIAGSATIGAEILEDAASSPSRPTRRSRSRRRWRRGSR